MHIKHLSNLSRWAVFCFNLGRSIVTAQTWKEKMAVAAYNCLCVGQAVVIKLMIMIFISA
ncbi:hypothetical protein B1207_06650 [Legionella quinlivanii]|uniref:Uncharacterized protein n=1 Tax=Legionella quinlivanii TaxID=45073 RepID=A0A364LKH5_9GAMM|nr:hypothetical protein B1207_06650 [Legionella quinlivanii]